MTLNVQVEFLPEITMNGGHVPLNGLQEMLEAKSHAQVDILSALLRATVNSCCGESSEIPVTTVLTMCFTLVQ